MKDEGEWVSLPELREVWQRTLGWHPSASQQTQFQQFYELILQKNRQLNLTRITEPEEFWEKHLWDSLSGLKPWLTDKEQDEEPKGDDALPENGSLSVAQPMMRVIDIGTGAGFPGVPVAIAFPSWSVTLLDSTRKKLAFLDTALADLSVTNATTLTARVEQVGQDGQHRETYDLVLVRAVAAAAVCAEYALPLLKPGGAAVLYRGQWTEAEAIALPVALQKLGGNLEQVDSFTTPLSQGVRHCLLIRKHHATPMMFPRAIGLPKQNPL
jgi:16S rRNA (guanine527-N7)-methyltransferase